MSLQNIGITYQVDAVLGVPNISASLPVLAHPSNQGKHYIAEPLLKTASYTAECGAPEPSKGHHPHLPPKLNHLHEVRTFHQKKTTYHQHHPHLRPSLQSRQRFQRPKSTNNQSMNFMTLMLNKTKALPVIHGQKRLEDA